MGVNECGLVIGTEAEGSRCEGEKEEGLLGMDLLRLALERADTARKGVDVITALLTQYGQNANASPLFDRRYENSFLLVDREEIWLLETAGRQWAAKKITDWAAISNCYCIGTDYTLCSDQLEEYARNRRWLRPDEPLDFAKAYTLPALRQSQSTPRFRRLQKLISAHQKSLDMANAKEILRDHFEGEIIEPRFGACYGGFVSICMHAMTWDSSQTAASLLCHWDDLLGPVSRYSASMPCCSVFIPVYWAGDVPDAMKNAGEFYREDSLWWETERRAMLISVDESRYGAPARAALRKLDDSFQARAESMEQCARDLMQQGEKEAALQTLAQLTEACTAEAMQLIQRLAKEISDDIRQAGGLFGPRKEFLEAYMQRTKLELLK